MARRRIVLGVALGALLLLILTGGPGTALTFLPALGLLALPLTGRFLGEDRIVRRLRRARSWPRRARARSPRPRAHELPLTSALARLPLSRRGPPVHSPA